MKPNPRVDAYIAEAEPFARPILAQLRLLVGKACPQAEEDIKWGSPFFLHSGILCFFAGFKNHCAFGFWHRGMRPFVKEAGAPEKVSRGHFGKIEKRSDLPKDAVLIRLIKEAVKLNESGAPPRGDASRKPKPEAKVPPDLRALLAENAKAKANFEAFAPSHRREYVDWITEAKRPETREKRLKETINFVAQGKSRNWKYEKC